MRKESTGLIGGSLVDCTVEFISKLASEVDNERVIVLTVEVSNGKRCRAIFGPNSPSFSRGIALGDEFTLHSVLFCNPCGGSLTNQHCSTCGERLTQDAVLEQAPVSDAVRVVSKRLENNHLLIAVPQTRVTCRNDISNVAHVVVKKTPEWFGEEALQCPYCG